MTRFKRLTSCATLLGLLLTLTCALPARAADPFDSWQIRDRGRVEIGFGAGGVTNDPFLERLLITARVAIHAHELFAIDLRFFVSPNLGESDLKETTFKMMQQKEVVPDISRLIFVFTPGVLFTPLHVEAGRLAAFDLSFFFGGGMLLTHDDEDLIAMTSEGEEYFKQVHPGLTMGMSLRVLIEPGVAFSFHPQMLTHIEQVHREDGMNLEMKNNLMMVWQVSFLTPGRY